MPGFLLLFSLLIAVGFFLLWPPDRVARTLFFPGTTEASLTGERRFLPRTRDRERSVELVVEDLLLGPARISHSRALPRATRVASLILDDDVMYLDLTDAAMFETAEVHVDVPTGIDAIRTTALYNFRFLEEAVITIDGEVPFSPAYRAVGR